MWLRLFTVLCFSVFLTSCGRDSFLPKNNFPEPAQASMALALEDVLSRDVDGIMSHASAELNALDNVKEDIAKALKLMPDGALEAELIIIRNTQDNRTQDAYPIYTGIYEITNGDEFVFAEIGIENAGDCCKLRQLQITQYGASPSHRHDFKLSGKPLTSYFFIIAAIFIPIFILVSLISCWRNNGVEKKWRWRIFIIVGLYGLSLNWTTNVIGAKFIFPAFDTWNIQYNSIQLTFVKLYLFGVGFTRSALFAPWIIDIGFPLGACLYWRNVKRGKFSNLADVAKANTPRP